MSQNESERERQAETRNNKFFRDDTRFALGRIAIFQYVIVAVFLFLLAGFWILQVRDHEANSEMAERKAIASRRFRCLRPGARFWIAMDALSSTIILRSTSCSFRRI